VHSCEEKREPVRRRKNGRGGKGGMMFGECGREACDASTTRGVNEPEAVEVEGEADVPADQVIAQKSTGMATIMAYVGAYSM
jgi:hypothetical protein